MEFRSHTFTCNHQTIHAKIAGKQRARTILMLHGFPEFWRAWAGVAEHLADDYQIVLPDQRGYNLSDKPTSMQAYHTKHLVADMAELISHVSPDNPVILCGHDWGASVAYLLAMRHPDKISHLIIANGVHPVCFQKALFASGKQTVASQYITSLRQPDSEDRLSEDHYAGLLDMFRSLSAAPWLKSEDIEAYLQAWSGENCLSGMINWYRASPLVVPGPDTPAQPYEITEEMRERYRISMPHLLIWGCEDKALLPESYEDLPLFAEHLEIDRIGNASHWILHEEPGQVAMKIDGFVNSQT